MRSLGTALLLLAALALAACGGSLANEVAPAERDLSRQIESGKLSGETLANAYLLRGNYRMIQERIDLALGDYDQTIAMMPDHETAYAMRATAWRKKGQLDRAIEDYSAAIARAATPTSALYFLRGQTWAMKGGYVRAVEDYDRAIEIDSRNWELYAVRGATLTLLEHDDLALADLDKAIELDPGPVTPEPMVVAGDQPGTQYMIHFTTTNQSHMAEVYANRVRIWIRRDDAKHAIADGERIAEQLDGAPREKGAAGPYPGTPSAAPILYLGLTRLWAGNCRDGYNNIGWYSDRASLSMDAVVQQFEPLIAKTDCAEYWY